MPKSQVCLNLKYRVRKLKSGLNGFSESYRYMAYNKAAWSMKRYAEVLHRPEDALEVPHVGPRVVEELKARVAYSSSSPQGKRFAKPEKAPGRPKKSKPSAKILAVPSAPIASSVSSLAPVQNLDQPSLTKGDIFPFCYLSYDNSAYSMLLCDFCPQEIDQIRTKFK